VALDAISSEATSTLWRESNWTLLLAYIDSRCVIPIVGPELLQVEVDGTSLLLDRYLANRLAELHQLPVDNLPAERPLNHVVVQLRRLGLERAEIKVLICEIIDKADLSQPEPLRQLAEITDFDLFVTTTFDPLLEKAIDEVRFGNSHKTESISYTPRNDDLNEDLSVSKKDLTVPTVYYLMGKYSHDPSYVVSDEDLLELVCRLQHPLQRPTHLLDKLAKNHLLILGANFPYWLAPIFLRTAKGRQLSMDTGLFEFLADSTSHRDASLVSFLLQFSTHTKVYRPGGAIEFVDELWKRWRAKHPQSPASRKVIFISYAREDLAAVQLLKEGLNAAGLNVWLDFDKLKPGGSFHPQIHQYITEVCCCFLAVISKNTEARREGFFRREWNFALERDKGIYTEKQFIVPVVIDDIGEPLVVEPRFKQLNYRRLAGGKVTPEFVKELKEIVGES